MLSTKQCIHTTPSSRLLYLQTLYYLSFHSFLYAPKTFAPFSILWLTSASMVPFGAIFINRYLKHFSFKFSVFKLTPQLTCLFALLHLITMLSFTFTHKYLYIHKCIWVFRSGWYAKWVSLGEWFEERRDGEALCKMKCGKGATVDDIIVDFLKKRGWLYCWLVSWDF